MNEGTCFVALLSIELHIPYAQSLKEKRQQVRELKNRICIKFNASVAYRFAQNWQFMTRADVGAGDSDFV
jgi:uncharacterized protein YlxP (DUF503 family)